MREKREKREKIGALLAEWSKALRLGRSLFGCVGSNPTSKPRVTDEKSVRNCQQTESDALLAEWSKEPR